VYKSIPSRIPRGGEPTLPVAFIPLAGGNFTNPDIGILGGLGHFPADTSFKNYPEDIAIRRFDFGPMIQRTIIGLETMGKVKFPEFSEIKTVPKEMETR
jgi:hypothetical protein